jgi:Homeodomain-like domain-containing protein
MAAQRVPMRKLREIIRLKLQLGLSGRAIARSCNLSPSTASDYLARWLRIIGYNAVSAWRQQAPRKDRMPIAWERAKETLRDALLLAQVEHHEAIQGTT